MLDLSASNACHCPSFAEKQRDLMMTGLFHHFLSDRNTSLTRMPTYQNFSLMSTGRMKQLSSRREG